MRISDWSSDVCSSDLRGSQLHRSPGGAQMGFTPLVDVLHAAEAEDGDAAHHHDGAEVAVGEQVRQRPEPGAPEEGVAGDGGDDDGGVSGRAGEEAPAADQGQIGTAVLRERWGPTGET